MHARLRQTVGAALMSGFVTVSGSVWSTVVYRCEREAGVAFTQFPCAGAKAVALPSTAGSVRPMSAAERAQLAELARAVHHVKEAVQTVLG